MGFLGDIWNFIATPLYYAVSAVLVGCHNLFGALFGPNTAASWILSIIGLTVVIRAALIPLFVKQIKASRNMQLLQPKMKELQKKYGHDRERLAQETMALYRESGTNPFASCLPLIVQMPVFIVLLQLLEKAAKGHAKALLSAGDAHSFQKAKIFGGQISSRFVDHDAAGSIKILAVVLIVAMIATQFLTQRQLMSKNMPSDALNGPYAQQQKILLYVLPVVFAVSGIAFPVGVMLYWTTSNLWTMGQQFYVIRNNPAPGTPAFEAKKKRDAAKGKVIAPEPEAVAATEAGAARRPATRQQPKNQSRSQRQKTQGARPANSSQIKRIGPKEDGK
ncbi:MAG: membrane protein insertase YidC [Marmoricola sp.]